MIKWIFLIALLWIGSSSTYQTSEKITLNKTLQFETISTWAQVYKNQNKSIFQTIYRFKGSDTLKSDAKLSIELSDASTKNIRSFSETKRKPFDQKPGFIIKKIITPSDGLIPLPYAIGYWCTLNADNNDMQYLIIHAIHQQKIGLSMVLSCHSDDFKSLESEWIQIVKSLTFIK
jgi:hypothetical protein